MPPLGRSFPVSTNSATIRAWQAHPGGEMIVSWVEGGAPWGDDIYMPRFPEPRERRRTGKSGNNSTDHCERGAGITLKKALTRPPFARSTFPQDVVEVTALRTR